jgi:hypothetical protein
MAARAWSLSTRLAVAAGALILAMFGFWMVGYGIGRVVVALMPTISTGMTGRVQGGAAKPERATIEGPNQKSQPAVQALSISPVRERGAREPAASIVTTGTDIVRLRLQAAPGESIPRGTRARVRAVAGYEVWSGAAAEDDGSGPQGFVRIDLPASRLPPGDYTVLLFGLNASGQEAERYRYAMNVRRP